VRKLFIFILSVSFLHASVAFAGQVRNAGGGGGKTRATRIYKAPTPDASSSTGTSSPSLYGVGSLYSPDNISSHYGRYGSLLNPATSPTSPSSTSSVATTMSSNPMASIFSATGNPFGQGATGSTSIPNPTSPSGTNPVSSSSAFGPPAAAGTVPEGSAGFSGYYSTTAGIIPTTSSNLYGSSSIRSKRFFVMPNTTSSSMGQTGVSFVPPTTVNPFTPNPFTTVNPFAQSTYRVNPFASNWANPYNNISAGYPGAAVPTGTPTFSGP